MKKIASVSSLSATLEYQPTLTTNHRLIPSAAHKTSAIAATSLSPVKETSKPSTCPDSADSTTSLSNGFKYGINIDSPLTDKHLSSSCARDLPSSKLRSLFTDLSCTSSSAPTRAESKTSDLPADIIEHKREIRSRGMTMFEDDLSPKMTSFLDTLLTESKTSELPANSPVSKKEKRSRGMAMVEDDLSPKMTSFLETFLKKNRP